MKRKMYLIFILVFVASCINLYSKTKALGISSNGRYFVEKKSGKPVFIFCDTAWNLCALTREEIDIYVRNRSEKGFNVIMLTLNFYPQAKAENAYGEATYIGDDKTELNPKNLVHADYIINKCEEYGMYVMIYALWGGKSQGTMNNYNKEQLYKMGSDVGNYFGGKSNVILITGGETTPHFIDAERVASMGKGLKDGCKRKNLVGVHPVSEHSTSEFFANSDWLDFYMIQGKSSVKGTDYDFEKLITSDYNHSVVKPTMLGEHRYESGTDEDPAIQRRPLYISVFAGGAGYAYGHNALWQMTPHTGLKWMLRSWTPGVKNWKDALDTKAVSQLKHIQTLLYTYPFLNRIPDQSLLTRGQQGGVNERIRVTRDGEKGRNDATYIMAYLPVPREMEIRTSVIKNKHINIYWFNPRTGLAEVFEKKTENKGKIVIPPRNDGEDWVIVIEDASKNINCPLSVNNLSLICKL